MDVLAALGTPRGDACPSDFVLSEYDADVLAKPERAKITAHVEGCARCRRWLADGRAAFEALALRDGNAIVDAMHRAANQRRPLLSIRALTGLAALAAAFLLMVALPRERPDTLSKGGGLSLQIFRERNGKTVEVRSGDKLFAHDRLRFQVDLPRPAHVMIVGAEASNDLYRCFPSASDEAVELPAGERQLVPDAVELDGSTGQESIYLVACPEAFAIGDLRQAEVGRLDGPRACQITSFRLQKGAP